MKCFGERALLVVAPKQNTPSDSAVYFEIEERQP
jgi:hypothetical protein